VLPRNERSNLLPVGVDQLPHVKEHLSPPRKIGSPPSRKCRLGRGNSNIDLRSRSKVDGRSLSPSSRIKDDPGAPGRALENLPVHPVRDSIHFRFLLSLTARLTPNRDVSELAKRKTCF
jgi:hypothetical protein